MNLRLSLLPLVALLPLLPGLAWADALMDAKVHQNADSQSTIYLGTVAVGGQANILEALEDIKLALEQPLSNDPELADVVVCRITDDIGTHAIDAPSGGDNPKGSSSACATGSCFEDTASILNQSVNNQRKHYLKQQVNGASLHALLAALPYPKQVRAVPASVTVPAPAAVTAHV
jgi:hypothetical protein